MLPGDPVLQTLPEAGVNDWGPSTRAERSGRRISVLRSFMRNRNASKLIPGHPAAKWTFAGNQFSRLITRHFLRSFPFQERYFPCCQGRFSPSPEGRHSCRPLKPTAAGALQSMEVLLRRSAQTATGMSPLPVIAPSSLPNFQPSSPAGTHPLARGRARHERHPGTHPPFIGIPAGMPALPASPFPTQQFSIFNLQFSIPHLQPPVFGL